MIIDKCNNHNVENFLSLTLLYNLSNNYAYLFSKYYLPYFTLFRKIINHTNEYLNNNTSNMSPYLSNYYFDKWLKLTTTKSNNQLTEFVDPFKEYIEI